MKELPILFSGDMVRAILDGKKTQTRRVITQRLDDRPLVKAVWQGREPGKALLRFGSRPITDEMNVPCPYGQPGDLLYLRETWATHRGFDGMKPSELAYDGGGRPTVNYRADPLDGHLSSRGKWRPSIHMPKAFARIWLRVTEVRVERVQEISDEDSHAEGITDAEPNFLWIKGRARNRFRTLWDSTNAKHPWESRPWVWALTFERAEAPA